MKKRVVIIHGWADKPTRGWLGHTADTLRDLGYEVTNPQMPREKMPNMNAWLAQAQSAIGNLNEDTVLVGHSLGTYILLSYLSSLSHQQHAQALILVAGFATSPRAEADTLFINNIDLTRVKQYVNHIYHFFSDSDPMLNVRLSQELAEELSGEVIQINGYKHFTARDLSTFPQLIDIVKRELPLNETA